MKATLEDLKMELWLRNREEGRITCRNREGMQVSIKDIDFDSLADEIKRMDVERQHEEMEREYNASKK